MTTLIGVHGYLLKNETGSGAGVSIMDARASRNFGYLMYVSTTPSALIGLDVSHDGTGWMRVGTFTATTTTATAQVSAYYPYLRGVYSGFGNGSNVTGSATMFYAPGVMRIS